MNRIAEITEIEKSGRRNQLEKENYIKIMCDSFSSNMFCFFAPRSSRNKDTDDCYGKFKQVNQAEVFDLDTKCKKCHSFLSNRIEELTEAFNEGLLTDDEKDANRNEEDASQDLLLDDDDEDEIIGQTTTPIFIDFEGLELFRRELSKKFDSVI